MKLLRWFVAVTVLLVSASAFGTDFVGRVTEVEFNGNDRVYFRIDTQYSMCPYMNRLFVARYSDVDAFKIQYAQLLAAMITGKQVRAFNVTGCLISNDMQVQWIRITQ